MEQGDKKIILKPDVGSLAVGLFFGLGFFLTGMFFLFTLKYGALSDIAVIESFIGAVLSLGFFGPLALIVLYRFFTRRKTLTLTKGGIFLNYIIGPNADTFIPWTDIRFVDKTKYSVRGATYNYLSIYLKNPEKYRFNPIFNSEGADVQISELLLPCSAGECIKMFQGFYQVEVGENKTGNLLRSRDF